jgi:hypothetical protein
MSPLQQVSGFILQLTRINLWIGVTQYFNLARTTSALAVLVAIRIYQSCRRPRTPRLRGPCSQSLLFGVTERLNPSPDLGVVYQDWEQTYGPVYEIPAGLGNTHVVLSDPKAITHILSYDTTTYHKPDVARTVARPLVSVCRLPFSRALGHIPFQFGDLIAIVEGETHKRLVTVFRGSPCGCLALYGL